MSQQLKRHCDCRNYASVDVVKGICHRTKDLILGDDQHCQHFVPLAKCRNCSHYSASGEEFLGSCNAEPAKPWTYPDLIAVTCKMYHAQAA
jgi:4-hydroxyphenylacetate decarboxylase small subunit